MNAKNLGWAAMVLVLCACDGGAKSDGKADAGASREASSAAAKGASSSASAAAATADVPVESDFEDEAFADINDENLDAKVSALESEIQGDKE
jgi:hypothetical protein